MSKRLIPGKTRNSKGKKVSHRPIRAKDVIFDEDIRKWYKKNDWRNISTTIIWGHRARRPLG